MNSKFIILGMVLFAGLAAATYYSVTVTFPNGGEQVDDTITVTADYAWDIDRISPNITGILGSRVNFYYERTDGTFCPIGAYHIKNEGDPFEESGTAEVEWDTNDVEDGDDYKIVARLTDGSILFGENCYICGTDKDNMKILCDGKIYSQDKSDDYFGVRMAPGNLA